jgi:hypothetical protein
MRFTETMALIAMLGGDEAEAARILADDMLPGERHQFMQVLDRLSTLCNDRLRCPRCHRPADRVGAAIRAGQHWHRACLAESAREQRERV